MKIKTRFLIYTLIASLIFFIDFWTKIWAVKELSERGAYAVTSFFNLTVAHNTGISFGLCKAQSVFGKNCIILITCILLLVLFFYLLKRAHSREGWGYTAMIAGGLGNLYDRFFYGSVIDFIQLHGFGYAFPTFNIADTSIFLGALWICLCHIRLNLAHSSSYFAMFISLVIGSSCSRNESIKDINSSKGIGEKQIGSWKKSREDSEHKLARYSSMDKNNSARLDTMRQIGRVDNNE